MKKIVSLLIALVLVMSAVAFADSPFTEENPGSLTVCVYDRSNMNTDYGTATNNQWTRWIAENFYNDTYINLEFVAIPRSGSDDVITTMMAGGNCPDIFFTYDSAMLYEYAKQGGLAELSDAIDQYGDVIQTMLGDMLPYGYCSGGQYAIPAKRASLAHLCSFIRADWLEKIDWEIKYQDGVAVFTYDELEEILSTWKQEGICEYPMALLVESEEAESMSPVYLSFVDYDAFTEEDLATKPDFMWPGVKNGFEFLNKLFNEQLIQPDWAQYNDEVKWKSWIANGDVGFWAHACWREIQSPTESVMTLYNNEPSAKVIPCAITNEDGVPAMIDQYAPYGMYIMVPATSQHVNEAVMYLNWQAAYENYETLAYGFEGEHFVYIENNAHDTTQHAENASARISISDLILVYNGNPFTEIANAEKKMSLDPILADTVINAQDAAMLHTYIPYDLGRSIDSYGEYGSALKEKITELQTKSITCAVEDFDETFDRLVEEYLGMGGQIVLDEKLSAYEDK